MITEKDLQEAIAECQGQRNPNASTCLKLAAYYVIQDKMFGKEQDVENDLPPMHSYSSWLNNYKLWRFSDTEFSEAIQNKTLEEVLPVIDELVSVIQATNPRLYNAVMRKIKS